MKAPWQIADDASGTRAARWPPSGCATRTRRGSLPRRPPAPGRTDVTTEDDATLARALEELELLALFGHELTHHWLLSLDERRYLIADRLLNAMAADVTATPMKANSVMVVGRPLSWPSTCARWSFA